MKLIDQIWGELIDQNMSEVEEVSHIGLTENAAHILGDELKQLEGYEVGESLEEILLVIGDHFGIKPLIQSNEAQTKNFKLLR